MFLKTLGSLGVASLELGEYKAALKHLLRLQEFVTAEGSESGLEAPPETVLHLYLCLAYCGIGQHQDALIQINHCIAEHPTSGDYQMIRLKIYMSTGQVHHVYI